MNTPKAILFDLDDTLLELGANSTKVWQVLTQRHAAELHVDADVLLNAIETARRWYWDDANRHQRGRLNQVVALEEMVRIALEQLKIDAPHVPALYAQQFDEVLFELLQLFPGAIDILEHLRGQGIKLGMITNGSAVRQRRKIEQFQLARHFDYILVEEEFGAGKPDERVYWHMLAQLQVQPQDTWMIGDKLRWDVLPPQRLGMTGIWVDLKGEGMPANCEERPNHIVRNVIELRHILETVASRQPPAASN